MIADFMVSFLCFCSLSDEFFNGGSCFLDPCLTYMEDRPPSIEQGMSYCYLYVDDWNENLKTGLLIWGQSLFSNFQMLWLKSDLPFIQKDYICFITV